MKASLAQLLDRAMIARDVAPGDDDPTRTRILDAAVEEATRVGLERITVEQVVRTAGLGRMTVYRRFPRRDDLVEALVVREGERFLAAVAAGLEGEVEPEQRLAEGFVAAMRFVHDHPMLRRLAYADPGSVTATVAANDALLLRMGSDYILSTVLGEDPEDPSRAAQRVADLFARLFLTYVALPPGDPDPGNEGALRAFARGILGPLAKSALDD